MLNVYELIYMSRLGDENALATLLSYCMPVIYKEVNKAIELNSKLRMYYEDLIQESIVTFYYWHHCDCLQSACQMPSALRYVHAEQHGHTEDFRRNPTVSRDS